MSWACVKLAAHLMMQSAMSLAAAEESTEANARV